MRERRWGRVIAISSGAARLGLSGQAAYAASKAGLHGLIRTLAIESREHGITANCVLPGMVATPAVKKMPQGVLDRVLAGMPMGRMATPDEVAALVGFLASEDAGYITAQEISIDGGLGLNPVSLGSVN
jgi:NAD(P)-dependent dehydrogenase (short-subunit alcohol dehydrogenase family)